MLSHYYPWKLANLDLLMSFGLCREPLISLDLSMLNPILNNLFNILCFHRLNLFILALTKGFFLVDLNVKSLDKNRIFASCKLKMIKLIKLTFFCCSFNRFIEFSILISWGLGRQYNEYLFGLLIVFLRCFIVQTRI
jgi:hypothetical protein